jgi:hypothetical protein
MCRKIRCDGKSCKILGFWVYLNKASDIYIWLPQTTSARKTIETMWRKSMIQGRGLHLYFWKYFFMRIHVSLYPVSCLGGTDSQEEFGFVDEGDRAKGMWGRSRWASKLVGPMQDGKWGQLRWASRGGGAIVFNPYIMVLFEGCRIYLTPHILGWIRV